MESFRWDQHFITGLSEVDQQHHHIVDVLNQYGDLLAQHEVTYADIEAIFGELRGYATYHFDEEEKLMAKAAIDPRHFQHQVDEHRHFLQEVTSRYNTITPENLDNAKSLLEFLSHWLAFHILGIDQSMARQIAAIEAGQSAEDAYLSNEKRGSNATKPLLAALNGLFTQVSNRNRELLELNQTLEEKVLERTEALLEANKSLELMALTDTLTGLPNRRHAMHYLAGMWQKSTEEGSPLACMMIDADKFKQINDTYGHDAGDEVLRRLAIELKYSVRTDDLVCRLGGDEFFIICPNTPAEAMAFT
ncbi:MAG: diguanylate cyclase [Sedimenticola sp.]